MELTSCGARVGREYMMRKIYYLLLWLLSWVEVAGWCWQASEVVDIAKIAEVSLVGEAECQHQTSTPYLSISEVRDDGVMKSILPIQSI